MTLRKLLKVILICNHSKKEFKISIIRIRKAYKKLAKLIKT